MADHGQPRRAFWAAVLLTRALGAVLGDFLEKPVDRGSLELCRVGASAVLGISTAVLIALFPWRAAAFPPFTGSEKEIPVRSAGHGHREEIGLPKAVKETHRDGFDS